MIKFSKQGNGLREYSKYIPYIDRDSRSKNYFRLYDFPDRLYVGKNIFRMSGNADYLVRQSKIYIDIHDINGNIMYHEVLDVVSGDGTKTIVIYIYPDTPPGDATVYIAGRLGVDPRTGERIPYTDDPGSPDYKNIPNMLWVGTPFVITNKQNTSEIFFTKEPTIGYSERIFKVGTVNTGSSRFTNDISTGGNTISIHSIASPYQYTTTDKSRFADSFVDSTNKVERIPSVVSNVGQSRSSTRLPEYSELSVVTTSKPFFSQSMVGGMLYVRNINVNAYKPNDAISAGAFSRIPDYSASIVHILSDTSVQVDTPFFYREAYDTSTGVKDAVFTRFTNVSTFTASYYNTNVDIADSIDLESFITFEFSDIEPAAGIVDSVRILYKDIGVFGEYIDVGNFPVLSQNLLIDPNSLTFDVQAGVTEVEIGNIQTQGEAVGYWEVNTVNMGEASITLSNSNIIGGIRAIHSGSQSATQYVVLRPRNTYLVRSVAGTEYKLKFDSYSVTGSSWEKPFIDVYISGSSIVTDQIRRTDRPAPIQNPAYGTYIGTVDSKESARKANEFFFISKESKYIKPIFVIRSGVWDIGHVELRTRKEIGFSPNQFRLTIPITEFRRNTELVFCVEYYNSSGVKSNVDTKLYGVYFYG